VIHCGTHFLREALAAPPDSTVADEVFTHGLPSFLGLKAAYQHIAGQTWVDPEHYVNDTVVPIHEFYLGLTDFSSNATRREVRAPTGVVAHALHEAGWLRGSGLRTWEALQTRMNQQHVLGLLWNHNNENHGRLRGGGISGQNMDWGPQIEGVFASDDYMR
jgi:hypothetical protein